MIRRLFLIAALALGVLGVAGPIPSAGAGTVSLTTSPALVVPGTSATVTGPAVTCPDGASQSLVVEAPGATAAVAAAQGAPISVALAVPAGTASAVYELKATCLTYGGSSTVVGTGWLTVTDANGIPPSSGSCTVADTQLAPGQTVTVECTAPTFGGNTPTQVWMYSDPVLLGTFTASATGSVIGQVTMPTGSALGSHTLVVAGQDSAGRPTFLTVGISVGSVTAQVAVADPLPATGGGIGLALPAAGLVGLGSVFAYLARWRERLDRRRA